MSQSSTPSLGSNPAEIYQQCFVPSMFVPWAHVLLDHAKPQPGERVLDVACGTGAVARLAAPDVGPTGTVDALDISPAMLNVARGLPAPDGASISWHEGSVLALPFPDGTFDLVLCQQGLQFFPDRAAAVREMRRVLSPGGRAVLSVWQPIVHSPVYDILYTALARHLGMTVRALATPYALDDAAALQTLFDEAGFQDVTMISEQRTDRFPHPERFAQLAVMSSAAAVPVFAQMDPAARTALTDAVGLEIWPALQPYIEGDTITSPKAAQIIVARR